MTTPAGNLPLTARIRILHLDRLPQSTELVRQAGQN